MYVSYNIAIRNTKGVTALKITKEDLPCDAWLFQIVPIRSGRMKKWSTNNKHNTYRQNLHEFLKTDARNIARTYV